MRKMRVIYGGIWAAMWLPLQAHAAIPDCAGQVEIANAHVVRVEKNGALILGDGRAIMLEGIRLPQGEADGAPRFLADQALAALTQMALAGPVTFTATPPKEDRYDRVRAQGFAGRTWLQVALLEQGLARVAMLPDRNECSPELYAAEGRARAARAGIWAIPGYAPKAPQQVAASNQGSFQLVDGWVTSVGFGSGRIFIDFGSNGRQSFTAVIAPEDKRAFKDFDLDGLNAKHIRIRGIVQDYRGRPEIALSNPAQIEMLN